MTMKRTSGKQRQKEMVGGRKDDAKRRRSEKTRHGEKSNKKQSNVKEWRNVAMLTVQ